MGDTLFIALRCIVSLAAVFGALWYLHRRITKGKGRLGRAVGMRGRAIEVVARQGLGAKAGIAVVEAGGRRYLLGVTEHAVNVLDRLDVDTAAPAGLDAATIGRSLTAAVPVVPPTAGSTVTAAVVVQVPAQIPAQPAPDTLSIAPSGPVYLTRRQAREAQQSGAQQAGAQQAAEHRAAPVPAPASDEDDLFRRVLAAAEAQMGVPPEPEPEPEPVAARSASPLAGSLLHPDTWRQTAAAIRRLR